MPNNNIAIEIIQRTVLIRLIFLNSSTLNGWRVFTGIKVKTAQKIIKIKLVIWDKSRIKIYKTTKFQAAGKPWK